MVIKRDVDRSRIRILRSLLFVPGTSPDRFAKAMASDADAVIFDLEDSVEPTRKSAARDAIADFVSASPASQGARFVRINGFASPWIEQDLKFVGQLSMIDGVVLPKTESPRQVEEVVRVVTSATVIPLLETARGILSALAIAEAKASVSTLLFGAEDLTAQLGVPRTVDGDELLAARSQVALAAAAVGADAVDGVFTDIGDTGTLRRDCLRARALGFHGKTAIHPSQISVINEVFSPSPDEIDRARYIVDVYESAVAKNQGVVLVDNKMVDAAVFLRAQRILILTEALRSAQTTRARS